jgi:biopolymer transport protein ExbB|tara:strand:- start:8220 stop:9635 length:1416 start_codon:yes stop_codon:yes gene_type:complete
MKPSLYLTLGFAAAATFSHAQFTVASGKAETRRAVAIEELATLHDDIAPAKAELGAKLALLEEELRKLQSEAANAQRIADTQGVEVNQLDREIASLEDTNSYIQSTLLNEYIRRLNLTLDPAEVATYQDTIRKALEIVDSEDGVEVDQGEIFTTQLSAIDLSLNRISSLIGGSVVSGQGVLGGEILDGDFALLGPNTFFSSGESAGIVLGMKANSNIPNVYSLPEANVGIAALTSTKAGTAPLDATGSSRGGDLQAPKALDTELSLVEEFEAGGWVMPIIVVCLVIGCFIGIFKIITLLLVKKAREADLQAVLHHLREGNKDAALSHAKSIKGPAGELLTAAVESAEEDKEVIEEVIYEVIVKNQPKLEQLLPVVALIAAVAPLLGLLGTVTGMINTFKLITIIGTGDAQGLSSGISEALITTKWGLITAIPTLTLHAFANRIAKGLVTSLEQSGVGFINGLTEIRESNKD